MCATCEACNSQAGRHIHAHPHDHGGNSRDPGGHAHDHVHPHDHIDLAPPPARQSALGAMEPAGGADLNIGLLDRNESQASLNRQRLARAGVRCANLMSSPGSGKTTLLEQTIRELEGEARLAVIEGDMTTELDADRLRACGAPVVAITTGRACHLEAEQIGDGLDALDRTHGLDRLDLLVIENVGNLICPAAFDLGEHARVVLVAVTEGEDKPLKYPIMFHGAHCVVITKLDIAPYLKLDIDRLADNIRQVNPGAEVFALSAETGAGMGRWLSWVRRQARIPAQDLLAV